MNKNLEKNKDLPDLEELKSIPIERKIWSWLSKYGHYLLNFAIVLLISFAFYTMIDKWNQHKAQKCLAEYAKKVTLEERVKWAESSLPKSLNNLRGFIFLENANKNVKQKNFEKSIVYFQKAYQLLKTSPLKEQAQSGCAFAYLEVQQFDMAEKTFSELYRCNFKYLRAQALYALCLISEHKNDTHNFEKYKKQLQSYEDGVDFINRLDILRATR